MYSGFFIVILGFPVLLSTTGLAAPSIEYKLEAKHTQESEVVWKRAYLLGMRDGLCICNWYGIGLSGGFHGFFLSYYSFIVLFLIVKTPLSHRGSLYYALDSMFEWMVLSFRERQAIT